jgi:hypothetical protein
MVEGLPKFKVDENICTSSCVCKQHINPIPIISSWRAKDRLELIHSDIYEPITPASYSGKRYILSFIDDFNMKAWIYLLVQKSEAFECLKEFKAKVELETGNAIKALKTDRGGEFISESFNMFCRSNGIRRQLTTSFTP